MSLDVAVIGIQLETQSVAEGERAVVGSFQRIGTSADAMGKQTDRAAEAAARVTKAQREQASIQQQVSAAIAEGRRRAQELQVTEANRAANEARFEAQRQQRLASERALAGNILQRAAAERVATEAMVAEAAAAKTLAVATDGVAVAGVKGVTGVRTLATAFSTLAASSVGLRGGLGSLVSTLGLMGPGAAITIGVTAGVTAMAAAWEYFTGEARKARKETDELMDRLEKAEKIRLGIDLQEDVEKLVARLKEANAELDRVGKPRTVRGLDGFGTVQVGGTAGDIAKAKAERDRVERDLNLAAMNRNTKLAEELNAEQDIIDQANELKRRKAEQAAAEGRRIREQEFRETKEARDRIADLIAGTGSKGNQLLVPTVSNNGSGLTASERILKGIGSKPLLEPSVIDETGRRIETRMSSAYDVSTRHFQRGLTTAFEGLITGAPNVGKQLGSALAGGLAGALAATLSDTLTDEVNKFLKGLKRDFNALPKGKQDSAILGGLGIAVGGLAIGYGTGSTGTGALGGAASGALAGSAIPGIGTAAGAIVGGVAGIVGGLLGSAKQAKEAAFRMEEAKKQFAISLRSYTDEAFGSATNLSRSIAANDARAEELRRGARSVVPEFTGYKSFDAFAAGVKVYEAELGKIDSAQRKMNDNLAAEEAIRLQLIDLSLTEREAKLAGNDRGALAARAAREEAEVQRQLRNNEITQAIADRTSAVISGELTKSLADLEEQARLTSQSLAESLGTRGLQARARLAGSDAEREAIEDQIRTEEKRIERERAVKDGVDATTLALLDYTQGLEDQAIAQERATNASKRAAEAAYAQARATEDLTIRSLRATGQGGAADVGAQIFQQQEEKRRALEEGRSAEFIKTLDRVQAEERAASDKARRDAQDQAFASAFGTDVGSSAIADSRTSVNLAVGASEGQVAQMTGILTGSLFYQASLPRIEQVLRETKAIVARWNPISLDDVDTGLALAGADANLAAGLPPSNR